MASTDLIWHLVKKNNAFLIKRDGCAFSTEPGNVRNLHSHRYSGIAQSRAVDLQSASTGKGVVLSVKAARTGLRKCPAKTWNQVTLKKDFRRTARSIRTTLRGYRSDLTTDLLARFTKLHYAAKFKGAVTKKPITRRARKSGQTLAKARRGGKAAKFAAQKARRAASKKSAKPAQ